MNARRGEGDAAPPPGAASWRSRLTAWSQKTTACWRAEWRGVLILIVGLCLFNRVEATARLLGRAAVVVARDPAATLTALTTPQSGEAVVGPRVMLLLRVLRAVSPPSFRFALSAVAHETDAHDLCEAAYPLRVVGDSPFVLLSTAEPLPAGCAIVHREEDVALARCL